MRFTDTGRRGPAPFTQDSRLLRLHTPLGPDTLVAEDIELWEGIGPRPGPALGDAADGDWGGAFGPWALDAALGPARAGLRFTVHALSSDTALPVENLVGQPALLELVCPDGLRPWHGHVVSAGLVGGDGGWARWRLVVEPWLALLAERSQAWVFQDLSVPRVIDAVFSRPFEGGCVAPSWRWALANTSQYPRRSLCVQHHESDLDFVQRLLLEEGLFCWWEHMGEPGSAALGRHTLVIAGQQHRARRLEPAHLRRQRRRRAHRAVHQPGRHTTAAGRAAAAARQ